MYIDVYDVNGDPYEPVAEKTMDYKIAFNITKLVDNNDPDPYYGYYGAADYGNNKAVLIFGEGFTAEEQDKFDDLAAQLTDSILATEPFKETQLYFNFTAVNTISNESGIGTEAKDTAFRLTYDEDGKLTSSYYGTQVATTLAYYEANPYYAACIVIVNDENLAESTLYGKYQDNVTYHYYNAIFITPDEAGMEYAAAELLNHLTWDDYGYRAETQDEKETQRLDLIYALHYDYAPIIVSRAYDETFVETGEPVDLAPYFQVYYEGELLPDVELALTYYDEAGNELDGAPSEAGSYSVLAETVPYDPDYEYEDYWTFYGPEGVDPNADESIWFGLSRGYTTFTISEAEEEPFDDLSEKTTGNAWYFDAVYEVRRLGLMVGVGDNRFEPTRDMTRAEAAVIVVKLAGIDPNEYTGTPTVFTDVPANHWGIDYIVAANENGLVSGRGDGTFDPDAKITREEFTTMLVKAVGIDADEYADAELVFPDVPADSWAAKHIAAAYENGLVAGCDDGTFAFGRNIMRCEVAVMLNSAYKLNLI